jgi:hypothetical protein
LVQFIKAMRDEEGKMVRNAHLIGTFRRIAKLLFHGIKPIFVFDGGVPVLKRMTVANRRLQREVHSENLRRQAQTILVTQLKRQIDEARQLELTGKKSDASSSTAAAAAGAYTAGFNPGTQIGTAASATITDGSDPVSTAAAFDVAFVGVGEAGGGGEAEEEEEDIEWEDGDVRKVTSVDSDSDEDGGTGGFGGWDVDGDGGGMDCIDESSLRAMPVNVRKGIIETVHRDYRKKGRDDYLNVGDGEGREGVEAGGRLCRLCRRRCRRRPNLFSFQI